MDKAKTIHVSKFEAARRQLQTAIKLWFEEGDIISIHTLAFASHEIIHRIYRKSGQAGLLWDSDAWPEDQKVEMLKALKRSGAWFKHAGDHDWNSSFEFRIHESVLFMMASAFAIKWLGELPRDEESAFLAYFQLHNLDDLPIEHPLHLFAKDDVDAMRSIKRSEFLERFVQARTD
jgi:hypothetical protein